MQEFSDLVRFCVVGVVYVYVGVLYDAATGVGRYVDAAAGVGLYTDAVAGVARYVVAGVAALVTVADRTG